MQDDSPFVKEKGHDPLRLLTESQGPQVQTPARPLAAALSFACLLYLFLYTFPFPLGTVYATENLLPLWDTTLQPVVNAFSGLFGVKAGGAALYTTDTLYNYFLLALIALVSVAGGVIWTMLRKGRGPSALSWQFADEWARFYLGGTLLIYAWAKIIPLQFTEPNPARLLTFFADVPPMGLLWTFMGHSPEYQIIGGLAEAVAGILLFWRRTSLLGAILSAGVMANVLAMNLFYDVPVKVLSLHLLVFSIALMAPHWRRMAEFFLQSKAASAPSEPLPWGGPKWLGAAWTAAKVLVVLSTVVGSGIAAVQDGIQVAGESKPDILTGLFVVEAFEKPENRAGALEDSQRWVRLGRGKEGYTSVVFANGRVSAFLITQDEESGDWLVRARPPHKSGALTIQPSGDGLLLEGKLGEESIRARLVPDPAPPRLRREGINWIKPERPQGGILGS